MSPFGTLFWGFLIVFIDIRINGFDLLIDLVGYVLVVAGLGQLAQRSSSFARARICASVLFALSVLDLFTASDGSGTMLFQNEGLTVFYFTVLLIVNLMLIYLICKGIGEMATAAGAPHLADLAMSRWTVFLITYVLSTVFVIAGAAEADYVGLAIVSVVASLVAALLIAGLLRRADKAFYPRGV